MPPRFILLEIYGSRFTYFVLDNQSGRKPLAGYLSILRDACSNKVFVDEERAMLLTAISDCEEYLNAPINTAMTPSCRAELDMLYSIFDNYVAHYSVELAMKVCIGQQWIGKILTKVHIRWRGLPNPMTCRSWSECLRIWE